MKYFYVLRKDLFFSFLFCTRDITYVQNRRCYITCFHVMLYNMCHVILYKICHVMLYNTCHVMSYDIYIMLCYITYVILCYITCVMLCYMTHVQNRICYITCAYLPTLPVFPGVSKFFIKSPGLPVRAPNLQDKMDFWAFLCFSLKFSPFFHKIQLFVFIVQFLGHFCTCLVMTKISSSLQWILIPCTSCKT